MYSGSSPRRAGIAAVVLFVLLFAWVVVRGADEPADRARRISAKVDELANRVEERLEARRLVERADAAVEAADAARGEPGRALRDVRYNLDQIRIELELTAEQAGVESPRYKKLSAHAQFSEKAYAQQLERAQAHAEAMLAEARREAQAARERLAAADARLAASKRELLELAQGAAAPAGGGR